MKQSVLDLPSQELLKTLFDYQPETGNFVRLIKTARRSNPGDIAGTKCPSGYINISIDSVLYRAHRLAWRYMYGDSPVKLIDHINGIRDDNRIINLREVSHSENSQNQKKATSKNKSTGLMGAYYHIKHKYYSSQINVNGKSINLGVFDTAELAHEAYLEAKRKYHSTCTI